MGSYGERELGFAQSEAKVILDHLEGVDARDVTGTATDPAIARKRAMLTAWVARLQEWAARAIDADPLLLDREYLIEGIYRKRNGDEKLAKRIAYRAARGLPLWPGLESESVAEASENVKAGGCGMKDITPGWWWVKDPMKGPGIVLIAPWGDYAFLNEQNDPLAMWCVGLDYQLSIGHTKFVCKIEDPECLPTCKPTH